MHYKRIAPSSSLSPFVLFFWEFEGNFSDSERYAHPITASIHSKLAFQFKGRMLTGLPGREQPLFKTGFQCQNRNFYPMSAMETIGIFGVYFQPLAIPLLFGTPAEALTDNTIEIADLLGQAGRDLEEKVLQCTHAYERVEVVSVFLNRRIRDLATENRPALAAAGQIVRHAGQVDINELIREHAVSERQFERRFKLLTGFSAKMFSRIVRFETCITRAAGVSSLTELAMASGYYDQSHMIKDFREFAGVSPKTYFRQDHSLFL